MNTQPMPEKPDMPEELRRVLAILSKDGIVADAALDRAQRAAALSGTRIDHVLFKLGLIDDDALARAWSEVTGLPLLDDGGRPETAVLPDLLSPTFLRNARVLPISATSREVCLAVVDPLDQFSPKAVAVRTSREAQVILIPSGTFDAEFTRLYGSAVSSDDTALVSRTDGVAVNDVTTLRDLSGDAPAIRLANELIEKAVERKASDIHIGVTRNGTRLRYRIDGVLQDMAPHPVEMHTAVISRLKVLAELDIAEMRRPQDGRIRVGIAGREIDLRISTMPHLEGEGVVLRILDRSAVRLELSALGFSPSIEKQLSGLLNQPHGIFLVTGPTGSGKTTTLYAALRGLVQPDRNVISVEDPVEYHIDGVAQIQVHHKIGLDFPTILRSVLRQDPDVIMVGEIRDRETAAIANQAALTGHFVLATLHTNSAAAALPRLIDMGVEPYLLTSTVRASLSQRLVRTPCAHCSETTEAGHHPEYAALCLIAQAAGRVVVDRQAPLVRSTGCVRCGETGYRGRAAIGELLSVNDAIREAVQDQADAERLNAIAQQNGLVPLAAAGIDAVIAGVTTPSELTRVIGQTVVL